MVIDPAAAELDLPEQIRLDQVVPLLKILDDQAIGIAVAENGRPVTCAKGCSTCCRIQMVPVAPVEAYALLRYVEELPEPRRSEIRSRFADRVQRLTDAGLAHEYLEGREPSTEDHARARMEQYLNLGLSCPFLEEDICSIYSQRPFACRQYLVTSPKEFCAHPLSDPVAVVPMILLPMQAALETGASFSGRRQFTMPLVLALMYAEAHREELEQTYPSTQVVARAIERLLTPALQRGSVAPDTHLSSDA